MQAFKSSWIRMVQKIFSKDRNADALVRLRIIK